MGNALTSYSGVDPGFFLGGGALVSCSTSIPINHIVFFSFFFSLQNTSCIRKPQVILVNPSPRSAPAIAPIPINAELPPLKIVYLHCNRQQINNKKIQTTEAKKKELSDNFTKFNNGKNNSCLGILIYLITLLNYSAKTNNSCKQ